MRRWVQYPKSSERQLNMPKFVKYVNIPDPKGYSTSFKPGDDVPDWALAKIKNPAIVDTSIADPVAIPDPTEPSEVPATPETVEEPVVEKAPTAPRKRTTRTKAAATEAKAD